METASVLMNPFPPLPCPAIANASQLPLPVVGTRRRRQAPLVMVFRLPFEILSDCVVQCMFLRISAMRCIWMATRLAAARRGAISVTGTMRLLVGTEGWQSPPLRLCLVAARGWRADGSDDGDPGFILLAEGPCR